MDFNKAFAVLIGNEGVFDIDPIDNGNWTGGVEGKGELKGTKYGISAAAYPKLDIKNVSLDDARAIYFKDYWSVAGCEVVPDAVKFDLFDFAVNSGPGRAAKLLQRSVGQVEDGAIGPKTIMAIGVFNPYQLRFIYQAHRMLLMIGDHKWPTHGKGWMTRLAHNALRKEV